MLSKHVMGRIERLAKKQKWIVQNSFFKRVKRYTASCFSVITAFHVVISPCHLGIKFFLIMIRLLRKDIENLLIEFTFFVLPKKWFRFNQRRLPRVFLLVLFPFKVFSVLKRSVSNEVPEALLQNFFPPFDVFTFEFNLLHFLFDKFLQFESLCQLLFSWYLVCKYSFILLEFVFGNLGFFTFGTGETHKDFCGGFVFLEYTVDFFFRNSDFFS